MLTSLAVLFTSCHLWVGRTTYIDIQDMPSLRSGVLMRDSRQCYESLETFIRKGKKIAIESTCILSEINVDGCKDSVLKPSICV
jgi:hypothetical protein